MTPRFLNDHIPSLTRPLYQVPGAMEYFFEFSNKCFAKVYTSEEYPHLWMAEGYRGDNDFLGALKYVDDITVSNFLYKISDIGTDLETVI